MENSDLSLSHDACFFNFSFKLWNDYEKLTQKECFFNLTMLSLDEIDNYYLTQKECYDDNIIKIKIVAVRKDDKEHGEILTDLIGKINKAIPESIFLQIKINMGYVNLND